MRGLADIQADEQERQRERRRRIADLKRSLTTALVRRPWVDRSDKVAVLVELLADLVKR